MALKLYISQKFLMEGLTITFVGSGRVSEILAPALFRAGVTINRVLSRNLLTAEDVALKSGAVATDVMVVPDDTDLVIIAVPDDSIQAVVKKLHFEGMPVVVHTSGSTEMAVLAGSSIRFGVVYPLQTFTHGRAISLDRVHLFTEASDVQTHRLIDDVAARLGSNVHHLDSAERRALHLSAVFVSNFVNHMLRAGFATAEHWQIDPIVFHELVRETVAKGLEIGPAASQTGPAARNDVNTIAKHKELLSFSDDLKNLYSVVTESIINHTQKISRGL
jgi:predicted short-subunit dehydrogenase-like oxidoreductase (DUF2520 family)